MRAAVFHDAKDISVEDVAEPTTVGPTRGATEAVLVRHLRNRPA